MIMITIIKWYFFIGCKTTQYNLYPSLSVKYSNLFLWMTCTQKGRNTASNFLFQLQIDLSWEYGRLDALKRSRPGIKKILKLYPYLPPTRNYKRFTPWCHESIYTFIEKRWCLRLGNNSFISKNVAIYYISSHIVHTLLELLIEIWYKEGINARGVIWEHFLHAKELMNAAEFIEQSLTMGPY